MNAGIDNFIDNNLIVKYITCIINSNYILDTKWSPDLLITFFFINFYLPIFNCQFYT
jgi:hypothetical protein